MIQRLEFPANGTSTPRPSIFAFRRWTSGHLLAPAQKFDPHGGRTSRRCTDELSAEEPDLLCPAQILLHLTQHSIGLFTTLPPPAHLPRKPRLRASECS